MFQHREAVELHFGPPDGTPYAPLRPQPIIGADHVCRWQPVTCWGMTFVYCGTCRAQRQVEDE